MKIDEPDNLTVINACGGSLKAIDKLIGTIQPGIYKLAVHVLGDREDAADATQEILLKVVTHLSSFRAEAAFATWVWRIAYNHLLSVRSRKSEYPEVSFEGIDERLKVGLELAGRLNIEQTSSRDITPQDKIEAIQVALACTQAMLMALDREHRLAYVIDLVFDLSSKEAAAIVGISSDSYRQRVSRARSRLETFMQRSCGIVNHKAACHCTRQLIAVRQKHIAGNVDRNAVIAIFKEEKVAAEQHFAAFTRLTDAAAVLRAHPDYRAPETQRAAILAVLKSEGFVKEVRN